MQASSREAYQLMQQGQIALARVEHNGIRVDTEYLERTLKETNVKADALEVELKQSDVWRVWQQEYGSKANLDSAKQLGEVFFDHLGYESRYKTGKTESHATTESAFSHIKGPHKKWVKKYFQRKKLKKAVGTYLENLQKETINGCFYADINLHRASSFRSSGGRDKEASIQAGSSVNWQNLPIRNPVLADIVRSCFIPRKGNYFVQFDQGQLEFRLAAVRWGDPLMIEYASDPTKDIHADEAMGLFCCDRATIDRNKPLRQSVKAGFVFAELYGSYWAQCAQFLWNEMDKLKLAVDGLPVKKWLRKKGIKSLGSAEGYSPEPGTYMHLVKQQEEKFYKRFPVFATRKKEAWEEYQKNGYFEVLTGFVLKGIFSRNQLMNIPIQSISFHIVLKGLILLDKWLRKNNFKTKILGTIHDSIELDVPADELQLVLTNAERILTTEVRKAWPWICVPLVVECEIAPLNRSWREKAPWICKDGVWQPKGKKAA